MTSTAGISPAIMINRIIDRLGTPAEAQLLKVAELRMKLQYAALAAATVNEDGKIELPPVDTGEAVDKLI